MNLLDVSGFDVKGISNHSTRHGTAFLIGATHRITGIRGKRRRSTDRNSKPTYTASTSYPAEVNNSARLPRRLEHERRDFQATVGESSRKLRVKPGTVDHKWFPFHASMACRRLLPPTGAYQETGELCGGRPLAHLQKLLLDRFSKFQIGTVGRGAEHMYLPVLIAQKYE